MFAKLINGEIQYAPKYLLIAGRVHYYPSDETYMSYGFLPVIDSVCPDAENNYESSWEEIDGHIVKKWTIIPVDPTVEYRQEICNLKSMLLESDYQAIKYAEGRMSSEEYAPIGESRQSWRDRINELELAIAQIEYGKVEETSEV